VAWVLGLAVLTLDPGGMRLEDLATISWDCLLCGDRGTADALLNVVLFVPLGIVLGGRPASIGRAALAGVLCSTVVELTQAFVPGRHPSPADVLWNATGAAVGALVYLVVRRRLLAPVRLGGTAWGVGLAAAFGLAGMLIVPAPTDEAYWGQRTPDLGHMPQYDGTVPEARLNGRPLYTGRIDAPMPHRKLLHGDWTLAGEVVVGTPPQAVSPILSIYDGRRREILLLGAHGRDLVFRERVRAHEIGFESPDLRLIGAFESVAPGDTVGIEARHADGVLCLRLGERERCGFGVRPGRTWGLLLYVTGPPEWFRGLVDFGWLTVLFMPLGFFATSRRDAAVGLVLTAAGTGATVALTPLLAPMSVNVLAALGGTALGAACLVGLRLARTRMETRTDGA
jgi:hypothetical protein